MEVIGFSEQRKYFDRAMEHGELAHAYLFTGPEMIGKRLFALGIAAHASNSGISPDNDPDIRILALGDESSNIPIEDIRDLKFFLSLTPLKGQRRVVVVDDAHRMTQEAANAFLKILEEPPLRALIILISAQPDMMPGTVVSRCQEIRFLPHDKASVKKYLQQYKLSDGDEELITVLADGRLGWLTRTLRTGKLAKLKKDIEEFKTVVRQGMTERVLFAQKVAERDDSAELVDIWLRWVRAYGTNPDKYRLVLARLLELRAILSEPQFNARLAIESFLLGL